MIDRTDGVTPERERDRPFQAASTIHYQIHHDDLTRADLLALRRAYLALSTVLRAHNLTGAEPVIPPQPLAAREPGKMPPS